MTRHPILPQARLTVTLGLLAIVALPTAAWCQDRATQDRLDRMERDLNMLQRQVYRGVPPTMAGDPSAAANFEIRMDRLEAQMRDLTGRIEEFTNEVGQLRQRLEQINNDIEVRLSQGPGAASAGAPPPPPGRRQAVVDPGGGSLTPPTNPIAPGTVVPPPVFGTLTPPGVAPSAPDRSAQPPSAGTLPSGSASDQYNYALGLLKQADYSGAEQALRSFVQQHPDDALAGSAQYWIGETLFARGKFAEAATAFAEGYKRFPKGAKAAEDLLKLSVALARVKQRDNACVALTQLDREFPNPGATIKERAMAEKKRLGC